MKAVLCDLDGTLADCTHRLKFVNEKFHEGDTKFKKNWKLFFEAMTEDLINRPLNDILLALKTQGYRIIFVTARPSEYYGKSSRWLLEQGTWRKDDYLIYMRQQGDFRADYIVKKELLDLILLEGFDPKIIFDDRSSVVEMWRENGFLCAQVANHDF